MADHLQTPQPGYSVAYDAQEQQQHQQQQIPQGMGQSYQMTSIPGGTTTFQHLINHFWAQQYHQIEQGNVDFKTHNLPLARIKKVMKTDEDVRMRMVCRLDFFGKTVDTSVDDQCRGPNAFIESL